MDNKDNMLQEDYKQRSTKSFLGISVVLVIVAILVYPSLQSYLSGGTLNLITVLPWFTVSLVVILLLSAIPIVRRRVQKKKEIDISRIREQAELSSKYQTELEESKVTEDPFALKFLPPKPGETFPTYKAPKNTSNDPYAAKPKGFAEQQAQQGYPQAPALAHLTEPTDTEFRQPEESSDEFYEFKKAMQVQGVTGTDVALFTKFQQFQQFQKMQAQALIQPQGMTNSAGFGSKKH